LGVFGVVGVVFFRAGEKWGEGKKKGPWRGARKKKTGRGWGDRVGHLCPTGSKDDDRVDISMSKARAPPSQKKA